MSTQLTDFAEACFNTNSVAELREALAAPKADSTDCEAWSITPEQWRAAIQQALDAKLAEAA